VTDARYVVFSILGMANPETYSIVPSYRHKMKQVLVNATQAAIKLECRLELLGACQNPERKDGLPSWIPSLLEKWKALPFQTSKIHEARYIPRLTTSELPNTQVKNEALVIQGSINDIHLLHLSIPHPKQRLHLIPRSHLHFLEDLYRDRRGRKTTLHARYLLLHRRPRHLPPRNGTSRHPFPRTGLEPFSRTNQKLDSFLAVLSDQAPDIQMYHHPTPVQNSKDPDAYLSDPQRNPLSWMQLNPRLSRSYLLPSSHASASPHQNHRVHEGLKAYGVGRRLCITKRGYLALIPAETQVGDGVALFKGATFPYVLRKSVDERFRGAANVLVGEAFIPGLVTHSQVGERNAKVLAREEWKIGLEGWIWIC
jgi:hypothetical protein